MKRTQHKLSVSENVDKTLREIAKKMGGGKVQVGFLSDSPLGTYPDGTPVASAMFWFEFGHGGQFSSPPRPVFRGMIAKESPGWGAKMAQLAKATNYDGKRVLALMGEDISGALQEAIASYNEVPLAESTLILRKKFWSTRYQIRRSDVVAAIEAAARGEQGATGTQAKPGVWTGQALRDVGYKVNMEATVLKGAS